MARFIYWPSKDQIPGHLYTIPKGAQGSLVNQIGVAECQSDFFVRLVKADGMTAASGFATLNEDQGQGSNVPITLLNVEHGDQVQVLHKVTKIAWSTPLKVRIAADEKASDAKARADQYAARPIGSAAHCPKAMTAAVWTRLLNFTKRHEGGTDFLYNDKGKPQRVTCGVGRMFPDSDDAVKNRQFFVNPDGNQPSEPEMIDDFNAAHNLKRTQGNLFDFALVTVLRLPWDKVDELLTSFMADKVRAMLNLSAFAKFASFPAAAQVACASIGYGSWGYGVLQPTLEAVKAQDWKLAAEVYKSPGWDQNKDEAHRALFREAAQG